MFSLTIRFEADNTNAINDAKHFQNITHAFNFPSPERCVISSSDKTPGWTLTAKFLKILKKAADINGRTLVICHYAGHDRPNRSGELALYGQLSDGKQVSVQNALLGHVVGDDDLEDDIDCLFIFDCCHAGLALRGSSHPSRIVEVIAAVDASDKALGNNADGARITHRTFTSKLADLVARKKRDGDALVFSEAISQLRSESPIKKPFHRLLLGSSSIRLAFQTSANTSPFPQPSRNLKALISVHISDDLDQKEIAELVNWLHRLDCRIPLHVEDVYHLNSVGLLLEIPYSLFLMI